MPHIGAAQAINPDATFGAAGRVYTSFTNSEGSAEAVAVQADQKIVAAGTVWPTYDWVATRYLPSGQPDPTFGVNGVQIFNFGFSNEDCYALAIQPADGKLLLGGQANGSFAVLRLLPNGQPDPAFDTDGRVQISFGVGSGSTIEQLLVQPDGKIVAVGWAWNGTDFDFAAARFLPTGAPDGTFGTGGMKLIPMGTERDQARAALLQPDGKIVLVGASYGGIPSEPRFGICRLTATGALDTSFGTGGKTVSTLAPTQGSTPWSVVRQTDGKLVVGGEADSDMAVARYTAAGALDATFGTNGYRLLDPSNGSQDRAYTVALQPNGKILLSGHSFVNRPGALHDVCIARFTSGGAPDASFGTGGALLVTLNNYSSTAHSMVWQADGKPVFAGATSMGQASGVSFGLLRLTSAGVTGLADADGESIGEAAVFPNPLTADSRFRFSLARAGRVRVELIDALGRQVALLAADAAARPPGAYSLPLPVGVAPGAYFVRLLTADAARAVRVLRGK